MNSANTALLLIDFQRDFCAPGGYADQCAGIEWVRPIIPYAQRALEAARQHGMRIIHTRENYAPDLSDCPATKLRCSERAGARYGSEGPMGRIMIRGEYGNDIIDELAPQPGETVLDKSSYGAFLTTPLDQILKENGITHLALAGVTADVCVHTTLREAADRGYVCYYLKDAISAFDPAVRTACENLVVQEGSVWGVLTEVQDFVSALTENHIEGTHP
ncbi:cysteine hydrolase family protein [Pontiella agarivorans]|uniref:Cysteine hydrolase n=1 Tax=Pontiella agarivorans TaxID=3038953 RepID=A0ABU5MXL1_9BACT|nr:isochorismatase family cysteine hydrolase [Pontiella agarivorans]MDZ8118960.1 cysteine hydrolase [Pontiella agarivorans]